jgi:hypothetical protein
MNQGLPKLTVGVKKLKLPHQIGHDVEGVALRFAAGAGNGVQVRIYQLVHVTGEGERQ